MKRPVDANKKPIEVGCKLRSRIFSGNKVACSSIEQDKGKTKVWLVQEQSGSRPFLMPKNSQWVVYKYPDKKKSAKG